MKRSAALFLKKVINSLLSAEAYSEPDRKSKTEVFTKIVNLLKSNKQFPQKALLYMFDEALNTPLI